MTSALRSAPKERPSTVAPLTIRRRVMRSTAAFLSVWSGQGYSRGTRGVINGCSRGAQGHESNKCCGRTGFVPPEGMDFPLFNFTGPGEPHRFLPLGSSLHSRPKPSSALPSAVLYTQGMEGRRGERGSRVSTFESEFG